MRSAIIQASSNSDALELFFCRFRILDSRFAAKFIIAVGISFIAAFFSLLMTPFRLSADEEYQFERMWPTLQQPWYFSEPYGVAADGNGFIYIADTYNNRIQKFTADWQFVGKWGKQGDADGELFEPYGVTIDGSGHVYVSDTQNNRIQKFTTNGKYVAKWGSYGEGDGQFQGPVGLAADGNGNIYVADYDNHRIQGFTSNGEFITKWGSEGSGEGQFSSPAGIAVDGSGNVYVADKNNHRIQKFSSDGRFLTSWGSEGENNGEFYSPFGVAVDSNANLYVADAFNDRIQKFDAAGRFVAAWGEESSEDHEFSTPSGIAVDASGYVFVADTYNERIQKYTGQGQFLASAGSQGSDEGHFDGPAGIAMDSTGSVYVVDSWNHRIQKFTADGQFVTEWGYYDDDGEDAAGGAFCRPIDIAIDADDNLYVTDAWNFRIQKFRPTGEFLDKWGTQGTGDGEFDGPSAIAVDDNGDVYVADTYNHRIQKFSSTGRFITKWGSEGNGESQFYFDLDDGVPGIAVDSSGYIYVADSWNHRIQKFDAQGRFVTEWGHVGSDEHELDAPSGIAIDGNGDLYVADTYNCRIQKFTAQGQFVETLGSFGSEPGSLNDPIDLLIDDANNRIYISDTGNHRIQVFSKIAFASSDRKKDKAIILAGGGPYPGNNIWAATSMLTNYAYRTLTYQGYTKDRIYYLSSDTDLDLDGNGLLDDVDADATNSNLQSAITTWAQDAENLLVYITDHGGNDTFRMSESELLQASQLDSWLDTIQDTIPGKVVVVYDACRSGGFVDKLIPPAGKERIVLTSAAADEEAIFCNQGSISFSFFFWGRLFNGDSFYDSYVNAKNSISITYNQNPQLEGNGNGTANEKGDKDAAELVKIGNEIRTGGGIPTIGEVSPSATLNEQTSSLLYASNVIDEDGISRVWAVITPPNYSSDSPDNPVTELPTIDLKSVGDNRYEAIYNDFTSSGTYNIAIFASDTNAVLSLPQSTTVTVTGDGSISPAKGFNCTAYLAANADLPRTWDKAECMTHYLLFGFWEDRAVAFNPEEYLSANPDLPSNWTYEEALSHYNVFGRNENRLLAFSAVEYLSLYPDLPQDWSYEQAFVHYLYFGKSEGRIASFDETAYLELYPDLPRSWGQTEAFYHYLLYGIHEGRVYDPYDEDVFLTD